MKYSPRDWPISAAILQFPGTQADGSSIQDATAEQWAETLAQVRAVGFSNVDLTDSWLRPGDLSRERRIQLREVADSLSLSIPVLSIVRKSVIDPKSGLDNLAYALRTIETAPDLGFHTLSIGLHQLLTEEQKSRLWFWTAPGGSDPIGDERVWEQAVNRIRVIGKEAANYDLRVSLEMYEDTYLGTAESAVRLVEEIDLPNVGLNPDIGNLVRLHRRIEDWQSILEATLPHTNYWQVKNYFRDENPELGLISSVPAPLELGFINYRYALNRALELGFDGVICCEHYGGDGLGVSARNQDYLRSLLEQSPSYRRSEVSA